MIDKNIFQIYHDKSIVPNYVQQHIKQLNPTYNYTFVDFDEGKDIIRNHFEKELADSICNTIDKLPRYCHKSDLLRYCLLYILGGVYIDCDLKPLYGFDYFFKNLSDITLYTSFGKGADIFKYNHKMEIKNIHKMMANGIFASKKKNPILLELINFCIHHPVDSHPNNRGLNVIHLYNCIEHKCRQINQNARPYNKLYLENEVIYLINQDESNDYGTNCFINEDNIVLINPNDVNYNFSRQTSSFLK